MKRSAVYGAALVFALGIIAGQCAQSSGIYARVDYMKVAPDKVNDYLEVERIWKKIHQKRLEKGLINAWYLYQVDNRPEDKRDYQFVTVNICDSFAKLENPLPDEVFTAAYSEKELEKYMAMTGQCRELIRSEVWRLDAAALAPKADKGNSPKILVTYMQPVSGKEQEYDQMERKIFQKLHQALVDRKALDGWLYLTRVSLEGSEAPYSCMTVNLYPSQEDIQLDGNELIKSTFPNQDISKWLNVEEFRKAVKTDTWKHLDHLVQPASTTGATASSSSQDIPDAMKQKKLESKNWYWIAYIKFKSGKEGRGMELARLFVKASEKVPGASPIAVQMRSGRWNMMLMFPMLEGARSMEWEVAPEDEQWFRALTSMEGSVEKSSALLKEWVELIQDSQGEIGVTDESKPASVTTAAPAQGQYFGAVDYMSIPQGQSEEDYVNLEKLWQRLHQKAVDAGICHEWALYRVVNGGKNQYVTVRIYDSLDKMAVPWPNSLSEGLYSSDESAKMDQTEKFRNLTRSEVWALESMAVENKDPWPSPGYIHFMKAKAGKASEYYQMERNQYQKVHQARIDAGQLKAWYFLSRAWPSGMDSEYDFMTINVYPEKGPSWDNKIGATALGKEAWDKISDPEGMRTIVRQEIWHPVLRTTAKKK